MIKQIADIIGSSKNGKLTKDEAVKRFSDLLDNVKPNPEKYEDHETRIEKVFVPYFDSTVKYRAVCTRCGAKSHWFRSVGLAKSDLNNYVCEVDEQCN